MSRDRLAAAALAFRASAQRVTRVSVSGEPTTVHLLPRTKFTAVTDPFVTATRHTFLRRPHLFGCAGALPVCDIGSLDGAQAGARALEAARRAPSAVLRA